MTYGRGRGVVVATGMETEFGKIARLLETVETARTPLQQNLDRVGQGSWPVPPWWWWPVVVAVGLLRGQPFLEMLIFGIALAVAVVPEALPAVVTISLALGVQRMVKRHALIRRLPAVETLGSVSVICSDKTGTLTRDEMTVRRIVGRQARRFEVTGAGYEPRGCLPPGRPGGGRRRSPCRELLRAAVLASDARLVRSRLDGEAAGASRAIPPRGPSWWPRPRPGSTRRLWTREMPRVGEIPFTSESKRMTTLHRTAGGRWWPSPRERPRSCSEPACAGPRRRRAARRSRPRRILAARSMAGEALRVLAVAYRRDATPGQRRARPDLPRAWSG